MEVGRPVFLCGALAYPAVLRLILGPSVPGAAAHLAGHRAIYPKADAVPLIVASDSPLPGHLIGEPEADCARRLEAVATVLGLEWRNVTLAGGAGQARAAARWQDGGGPQDAGLAQWEAVWAPMLVEVCVVVLRLLPSTTPAVLARRLPQMLLAAAGRLRAAGAPSPAAVRRAPGEVQIAALDLPYAGFFGVEEYRLLYARFNGGLSAEVLRSVFTSGDAVTVLPYDLARDRVLLIEQFRMGPLSRGDRNPWQLEAVAGRIDPGETPEEAGRREAVEEAGLAVGALLPVAEYYPTTGAVSEYLYSYVGLCDLPDGTAGVFGLEVEAEDIRGHLLPFDALMDLVTTGEVTNAALLISALWLQRERPRLRAAR